MESRYREISPSPHLAPFVECFWEFGVDRDYSARVLPDGCADILFTIQGGQLTDVQVIGVMTRPRIVPIPAGTSLFGVRFQPGMAGVCLDRDMQFLNDRYVPIQSITSGVATPELVQAFGARHSVEHRIAAIEDRLTCLPTITRVHRAIGELVGCKGQLPIDDFAAAAGVGERQLRRTCLKHSGLAPKHLARVLRFRHVFARLRKGERHLANLAFDCGYYDQAHMIRDFRELAGMTPSHWLRQRGR